jgi:phage baseplate assembly protein W
MAGAPDTSAKAFLGHGWGFPVMPGADGSVAMADLETDVRQAVHIILGCNPGERAMLPTFGAGLNALLFEPINQTTMALAQFKVQQALILWEPRIDSVGVTVTADPPNGKLMFEIRYRVRTTNTFYNLVYPFFLREGAA